MTADPLAGLEPGWGQVLGPVLEPAELARLDGFLAAELAGGHDVLPPRADWLSAFSRTPFDAVRVVILGQDPYHGAGQATGLAFAVHPGVPTPPSLRNVFAELEHDLGVARPDHGDLTSWADQGVLLLNRVLTVRAGEAASHAGAGWEHVTSAALAALAEQRNGLVFLLWGRHAQAAGAGIDRARHLVLEAPHPSPLSARRGFLGCGHFTRANEHLRARGERPIDWSLPALTPPGPRGRSRDARPAAAMR